MLLNTLCFLLVVFILAMPLLSDDDSASSDEKWCRRWRSERLLREKKAKEQQQQQLARRNTWGGSKPGKAPNIEWNPAFFHQQLMKDYFDESPNVPCEIFSLTLRMRRKLFLHIQGDLLEAPGDFFMQKQDALGKLGFSPGQKITFKLRLLANSTCTDRNDEWWVYRNGWINNSCLP